MIKPYDKKVPALLQSRQPVTDSITVTTTREFIEGYVLSKKWKDFPNTPVLVSPEQTEQGEDKYIKVRVIPYAD